uniref:Uncharacterized protein n=1 Tax=Salix viminalis TaxID=40686 RepID=A0A6N2JYU1_SALVM
MKMLRLRSLSLILVQRQTAASSSSNPLSTGQQTFSTGFPNPICTSPPSTSTQAPSFNELIGQVGWVVGGGLATGVLPPPPPPPEPGGGVITGGYVTGGAITGVLPVAMVVSWKVCGLHDVVDASRLVVLGEEQQGGLGGLEGEEQQGGLEDAGVMVDAGECKECKHKWVARILL